MFKEDISKSNLFFQGMLPGNIYRGRNRGAYGLIVGASNNEEQSKEVDRDQLVDVTRKVVDEWNDMIGTNVDPSLMSTLKAPEQNLVIQSPDSIYIEPFPTMLQCNQCHVLENRSSRAARDTNIAKIASRVRKIGSRHTISCKMHGCKGSMKQVRHISVHRCGKLQVLQLNPKTRGITFVGYRDLGRAFFQNYFFDVSTGQKIPGATHAFCNSCRRDYPSAPSGFDMRATPVDDPQKFYPKNIQYLCLKKDTGQMVSQVSNLVSTNPELLDDQSMDIAQGLLSCLLGLANPTQLLQHLGDVLDGKRPDKEAASGLITELTEQRATRQQVVDALTLTKTSQTMIDISTANFDEKITELELQLAAASGRFSSVKAYLDDKTVYARLVSRRRSMEAALMAHDFSDQRQSLPAMIEQIKDPITRNQMAQDADVLSGRYGVDEISHYKEVNVVMASIGYTREKLKPDANAEPESIPITMMGYEDLANESLSSKRMIYALPAKTEGLHIRLDPARILRWCVESAGWENPGEDTLNDKMKAKAYLIANCPALTLDPAEIRSETHGQDALKVAPFHLMHSISHCLLSTIKRHTGYDEKSVMEYLMPSDLSFLLYVTSVQNYTAGGLLTLFKNYLRHWFDDASNYALNCLFDPVCSDKGSSCSGCVQTVIGCETFNHGLSRSYLHGGDIDEARSGFITKGYWQ